LTDTQHDETIKWKENKDLHSLFIHFFFQMERKLPKWIQVLINRVK
jgi:hypothetical protein